jgi:hypothetical protein
MGRAQAGSQRGAPSRNLQNMTEEHADQPSKKSATPYRIHMLPLLNRHGGLNLVVKNVCICKMLCAMLWSALCN